MIPSWVLSYVKSGSGPIAKLATFAVLRLLSDVVTITALKVIINGGVTIPFHRLRNAVLIGCATVIFKEVLGHFLVEYRNEVTSDIRSHIHSRMLEYIMRSQLRCISGVARSELTGSIQSVLDACLTPIVWGLFETVNYGSRIIGILVFIAIQGRVHAVLSAVMVLGIVLLLPGASVCDEAAAVAQQARTTLHVATEDLVANSVHAILAGRTSREVERLGASEQAASQAKVAADRCVRDSVRPVQACILGIVAIMTVYEAYQVFIALRKGPATNKDVGVGSLILIADYGQYIQDLCGNVSEGLNQLVTGWSRLEREGTRLTSIYEGCHDTRSGTLGPVHGHTHPPAPPVGRFVLADIRLPHPHATDRPGSDVLSGCSLDVPTGSRIGIVGRNGSGKSQLLWSIMGWRKNATGRASLDGHVFDLHDGPKSDEQLAQWRNQVAFLDQAVLLFETRSVDCNKAYGTDLECADPGGGEVGRLSGGQRQRVGLDRVLAQRRPLVLLDEPSATMGPSEQAAMVRALAMDRGDALLGSTVVVVTHDQQVAESMDYVFEMRDGRLVQLTPTEVRNWFQVN